MKLLSSILIAFMFSGCSWMINDRIILQPGTQQYPLFPIEEFKHSEKCEYDMWEERDDDNNTYLVAYKKPALKCIEENKQIRSDKNLIIKKVKSFNVKLSNLNKIQLEKKPIEIK